MSADTTRPRILVLAEGSPHAHGGAGERLRPTLRVLQDVGEVWFVDLSVDPHVGRPLPFDGLQAELRPPSAGRWASWFGVIDVMTGRRPAYASRVRTALIRRWLTRHLPVERFDLVWHYDRMGVFVLPASVRRHHPRVVLDLVDETSEREVQIASLERGRVRGSIARWVARGNVRALQRLYRDMHRHVDLAVVSGEEDRERTGRPEMVRVIRNVYSSPTSESRPPRGESPTLLFVGLFAYPPNVMAARWLVDDIWPAIAERIPDAQLLIAGPGPLPVDRWPDGVDVLGAVPSMAPLLAVTTALVVPLRIGSGTRVKILEGWCHRVPVIATLKAVEGLGAVDGVHYLRAETPDQFADAVERLWLDAGLVETLTDAGHARWSERHSPEVFATSIRDVVRSALGPI